MKINDDGTITKTIIGNSLFSMLKDNPDYSEILDGTNLPQNISDIGLSIGCLGSLC